jgi:hypothetical protein
MVMGAVIIDEHAAVYSHRSVTTALSVENRVDPSIRQAYADYRQQPDRFLLPGVVRRIAAHCVMKSCDYWLYRWMDVCGVSSYESAKVHLSDRVSRQALLDFASEEQYTIIPLTKARVPSITAGRGIDLSGELDCLDWECRKARVDELLTHVCLYFDRVVVVVASAHDTVEYHASVTKRQFDEKILSDIKLLLYLRRIGAEPLLVFRQKAPACPVHWEESAHIAGLSPLLGILDKETAYLNKRARIELTAHKDHLDFQFVHPEFEHTVWGAIRKPPTKNLATTVARRDVCACVFRQYMMHLASDVRTAETLGTALGSTVRYHGRLLRSLGRVPGIDDAAFELGLPFLQGIDLRTVLKLRLDESEAFERFRRALRKALNERVRSATKSSAQAIAQEIEEDLIRPSIDGIKSRLRSAQRALAKKAALNLSLGALATACGLLTGQLILTTSGLGVAFGALNAEHKYIDERRELEFSDMYFLWRVRDTHARH